MTEDQKPRIACVGAGDWGKNVVRNFHDLGALSAVCEADGGRRRQLLQDYPEIQVSESLGAVLDDPDIDAVAVATPAATHARLVREALLHDKDVLVEKPLAMSVSAGEELVELARRRNRVLMVGHLLWYHPAVLRLKELVDDGSLGRIRYIYSNRLNLGKIRREENILWSFAPHDISVILGLLGELPNAVEAYGGNYLHDGIADVTVSVLSFPSGVKAHVFVSWLHPFKEQKLVVVGDRKMAVFDDTELEHKLRLYPFEVDWRDRMPIARKGESEPIEVEMTEPLRAECSHFLARIRDRGAPRTDGDEALRVLRVLEQCQRRLRNDREAEESESSAPPPLPADAPSDWFAHPTAHLEEGVSVGSGTKIWHFSHVREGARIGKECRLGQNVVVGPGVSIGDGVKIQNNVSVYRGVTLEDGVFCGPSMVFTNIRNPRSEIPRMDDLDSTLVRRGATLGANCTVVCGTTIGRYAFVGAGAVVTRDVPDHALVLGNPGRITGWMCACGFRLLEDEQDPTCRECGAVYEWRDDRLELRSEAEVEA